MLIILFKIDLDTNMRYQNYIEKLIDCLDNRDETYFVANQLLKLHQETKKRENVIILELGVDRGQSTKVFLNAIDDKDKSRLISIDIRDCSASASSDKWIFIQSDSTDENKIIENAPILKNGIDILYVDSLHTRAHVFKEISTFYKYMNKGSVIFFDDIDSYPYMKGQRKDNVGIEISNRKIKNLISEIFRANINDLSLTTYFGSTGLARLDKRCDRGEKLKKPECIEVRNNKYFWNIYNKIMKKEKYNHDEVGESSFLIDPLKFKE